MSNHCTNLSDFPDSVNCTSPSEGKCMLNHNLYAHLNFKIISSIVHVNLSKVAGQINTVSLIICQVYHNIIPRNVPTIDILHNR